MFACALFGVLTRVPFFQRILWVTLLTFCLSLLGETAAMAHAVSSPFKEQLILSPIPSSLTLSATPQIVTYTVTATRPVKNLQMPVETTLIPDYAKVLVSGGTCAGATLLAQSTCSFSVSLTQNASNKGKAGEAFSLRMGLSGDAVHGRESAPGVRVTNGGPTPPVTSYTITTNTPGNGTINCTPTTVNAGGSATCILTANADYVLSGLTDNGVNVLGSVSSDSYTVSNVMANHAVNATFSALPVAATPTFTPGTGTYIAAQSVTMSSTTPGAAIHYTTDGAMPTALSPAYSAPITVGSSQTIKAIAVVSGYTNSAMGAATYTIHIPTLQSINITPINTSIAVGGTTQFAAECTFTDGHTYTCPTVTWASDAEGIATVDSTGLATGVADGSTTITASAEGETSNSAVLAVIPEPMITSISPIAGSTGGGTSVTISGMNFTADATVQFGGSSAVTVVNSATSITAISPAGSAGTVDVTVTTVGGTSSIGLADQFTYADAPTVDSISPGLGSTVGGTSVTITGTNFTADATVQFGGSSAVAVVNSATSITAISPAGSAGTVDVTVTTAGGVSASSSADQFTYQDLTIAPSSTASVETPSTLTYTVQAIGTSASDLRLDPGYGMPSSLVTTTLQSDHCTGVALPVNGTCTFQMTVVGVSGQSGVATVMPRVNGITAGGTPIAAQAIPSVVNQLPLTVSGSSAVPGISQLSVTRGPVAGANTVTITGVNLGSATEVRFDSSAGTNIMNNTSTSVTVTAPAGAAGTIPVTVTTAGGTSNAIEYTYVSGSPTLLSITLTPSSPVAFVPGSTNIEPTQLSAIASYSDGTTADITNQVVWSIVFGTGATITTGQSSNNGQVTGSSVGVVGVRASLGSITSSAKSVTIENLSVGRLYNQGYVYCLGTSGGASPCAYLPSGTNPNTGAPYAGEVIAQMDNVSSSTGQQWDNGSYLTMNATSITNGQSNTNSIVNVEGVGSYAASTCQSYNSGDNNNAWYLPAKSELNIIYGNRLTLNPAANLNTFYVAPTYSVYWSSTEGGSNLSAWSQSFNDGVQISSAKNILNGVRCVRAF